MTGKPAISVVIGPTASGKTDFAIALAHKHNGAVISADSRQVYSGLDIGTAKPKQAWNIPAHSEKEYEDIEGIPHYLLNIRSIEESLTLSDWQSAAITAINTALASGYHPILTGGTMLYVDSILFHYNIPNISPDEELRKKLESYSTDELVVQLQEADAKAFDFIETHNRRRIIRALEVTAITGRPFSSLRKKRPPLYESSITGLFPGWDVLDTNIERRIDTMISDGLIEETRQLRIKHGDTLPLLQTMNYKESGQYIDGILPKEEARQAMIQANKRYARRQMRWWNNRKDIQWQDTTA